MGDVTMLTAVDNAELQRLIRERVVVHQAADPLARVTVIVDHPAQGWALLRQVATGLPTGAGLANVRTLTPPELLDTLACAYGLASPARIDSTLRVAVTEALLRQQAGLLAASKDHPDTAVRLGSLHDELAWCALDDTARASLTAQGVSSTARAAIDFAASARTHLAAALGETTLRDVAHLVERLVDADPAHAASALGAVVVTVRELPAAIDALLGTLAASIPVDRVTLVARPDPVAATVVDCPDPSTEVDLAVRFVAQAVADGASPSRVALLYSVDAPYARLAEEALAKAGVEWHGPTGLTLESTAVGRYAQSLLAMAAERSATGSGSTRRLLMRWFAVGPIYVGSERQPTGAFRALIRQEGLYGDAQRWHSRLEALADAAAAEDSADDDDASSRRRSRLGAYAAGLRDLVTRLDTAIDDIALAPTWAALGDALWNALHDFHIPTSWWQADPTERDAHAAVEQVLQESLPAIDAYLVEHPGSGLAPRAGDVALMLQRALADRRSRHGMSSAGVHVGPISSARALTFDHLVIIGAAEGLMPSVRGDSPLLPDVARLALRSSRGDLPTALEAEAVLRTDVLALCSAAHEVTVTYPRGAGPSRAVAVPSRYVTAVASRHVTSSRRGLTEEPHPLADDDLAVRAGIGNAQAPLDLAARVAAADAWAMPSFDRFFGSPGVVDGQAPYTLHERTVSASAIESYLHCPYHFFVQRVLGIVTDEFTDDVDEIAPKDLGTLLHHALERFLVESRLAGALPEPGEPWPADALPRLLATLDDEVQQAQDLGLTGWQPAWDHSYETVRECLPAFLEVDAESVRHDPPTRPSEAELPFGMDGAPDVSFDVTEGVVVGLRGSIDRLDIGDDPTHVGVVDYKSGKADGFGAYLGIPTARGKVPPRQKVQDLVYDAAIRALRPEVETVGVHFMFVPNNGDPTSLSADHEPDRASRLRELLLGLEASGATGAFPPQPSGRNDYCPVCKRLGGPAARVAGSIATDDDEQDEGEES